MASPAPHSGELWLPVVGCEGFYEVSNMGRVRRVGGSILSTSPDSHGYPRFTSSIGNIQKKRKVHVEVLLAFVGPRPSPAHQARHLNDDRCDNRLENLQWGTRSENNYDRVKNGIDFHASKTHCPRGHELRPENNAKKSGQRECKACSIEHSYSRYHGLEFSEERADEVYRGIVENGGYVRSNLCKRGHLLDGENLVPSSARSGKRACRACKLESSAARYAGREFSSERADRRFVEIMEGAQQ